MIKTISSLPDVEFTAFPQIEESRPVALVCSQPVKDLLIDRLKLPIVWQAEITTALETDWETQSAEMEGEVVYALGGGLPVDAGKYIAARKGLPLIALPTALSVDAFFTDASGVRSSGCVQYLPTTSPDLVIIDWEVLQSAPAMVRSAGICDVLSIAVGSWDWEFAHRKGKNPENMPYINSLAKSAEGILEGVIDCAEAAGKGDSGGLKQLLDCLMLQVQLCNQIGHARPEEGSEHYFAYAVENRVGSGKTHGELVGPGILIMAEIQGQDIVPLKKALRDCCIPLHNLSENMIHDTLRELPDYCHQHRLPFGIAHCLEEELKNRSLDLKRIF